jgi:hypothetical protein
MYFKSSGSVCFYIDVSQNYIEKHTELCAVQIDTKSSLIGVICIYRSPTGNTASF